MQIESSGFRLYGGGVISRTLTDRLEAVARGFPVVTVTGPRQSGKTTLCRAVFPEHAYANLEHPPTREFAAADPQGFLEQFTTGVVIDEVQRVPELLSFIQVRVDDERLPGEFVLTGSKNLALMDSVTQSLAGRTAVLHLLPLSLDELAGADHRPDDVWTAVLRGGYPAIHHHGLRSDEWLAAYTATYVERDVRQILNVGDLDAFRTFMALLAGRVGQLLNLSALGADAGVSHVTARSWLSVLATSFVAHRLQPLHRNLGKRLTKSPKPYLYDSGLLCHLLGIRTEEQLRLHPLRGAIFENWVVGEIVKARVHRGRSPELRFYRDHRGQEVDVVLEDGARTTVVEIKSGRTFRPEFATTLGKLEHLLAQSAVPPTEVRRLVVYAGDDGQRRSDYRVVPWYAVHDVDWCGDA